MGIVNGNIHQPGDSHLNRRARECPDWHRNQMPQVTPLSILILLVMGSLWGLQVAMLELALEAAFGAWFCLRQRMATGCGRRWLHWSRP